MSRVHLPFAICQSSLLQNVKPDSIENRVVVLWAVGAFGSACCLWAASYDVPDVLGGMAELAAGDAGREAEVADGDGIILVLVSKIVSAFSHGADEDAYALFWTEVSDVVPDPDDRGVEGERDFAAVRWEVVCDGIFDHFEKLLL